MEHNKNDCGKWSVSRTTIYRYLNKMEANDNENRKDQLTNYSDEQRQAAMSKYKMIKSNLEYKKSLAEISKDEGFHSERCSAGKELSSRWIDRTGS